MSTPSFEELHDQLHVAPDRPLDLMSRRRFLQGALAAGGALAMPLGFTDYVAAQQGGNTVVLTVTLGGGNDGLNTLGPFDSGQYRDLRGALAIAPNSAHVASGGLFFHPRLNRLKARWDAGEVAVVSGVGDPLKDQSHFSNLARWMSANPDGRITPTGWLGRWLDSAQTTAFSAVAVGGRGVPLHFHSENSDVTDLPRIGGSRLYGADTSRALDQRMFTAVGNMARSSDRNSWVNRVGQVNALSIDSARDAAPAFERELPENDLALDMVLAARVVNLGLGTRVLNVTHGDYDLHDDQIGATSNVGAHADLLSELDIGIDLFFRTLNRRLVNRCVVVVYSEFGRRVRPNGSRGTDHGTANHLFAIGERVNGGLYGEVPSLTALDDRGNQRVTTDFRRTYATILDRSLGGSSSRILGRSYPSIGFLPA